MTYEEMKARKEALEKDLGKLNKEMKVYEDTMYEGKLNKAIKLLEECGYYYNMYETVGEINCPDCNETIEIEFGDIIEMLKEFME
jgi:predicted translin family RNA/ssDNA-binding protein